MTMQDPEKEAEEYSRSRYYCTTVSTDVLQMDVKCGAEDFLAGHASGYAAFAKEVLEWVEKELFAPDLETFQDRLEAFIEEKLK